MELPCKESSGKAANADGVKQEVGTKGSVQVKAIGSGGDWEKRGMCALPKNMRIS